MHNLVPFFKQAEQLLPGKVFQARLGLLGLLARGHVLIEDAPGMGKTTLVNFVGQAFGLKQKRIQFTNDLLPTDILGVSIFNSSTGHFVFKPGPIFGELILADELNRAPPKTQSALLQAMEERKISAEGETFELPPLFSVFATQNPRGQIGTYPLPESQLDRFVLKFAMGYPDREAELALLAGPSKRDEISLMKEIFSAGTLLEWQKEIPNITTSKELLDYIQRLLKASRTHKETQGLSPRAGLDLVKVARAEAFIEGRTHVLPEDVQKVFPYVVGHRLVQRSAQYQLEELRLSQLLLKEVPVIE